MVMGRSRRVYAKLKRTVRQQRGKLYIMRVCISMLLCWHKQS
ncbi:small polypeptide DEVIL 4-like [Rhodamnia argentea]|uniref:Small polypeptide DEVIL 4-like n=1 Tax=Rhodamnia argentea TaxID=178133 RepID=A0ABM3HB44_9MYRT|nr:small polypeptide DEVIL 4-like [Rhodamnia argentea]